MSQPGKNRRSWDPKSLDSRPLKERPFLSTRQKIVPDDDILALFLCDNDSLCSVGHEVIRDFCDGLHELSNNGRPTQTKPGSARAWIDFRGKYQTRYRLLTEWYTAAQLQDVVNEAFSEEELPDIYRQLIFVPRLDRNFILALASSTLHHQRSALRDALYKHLACKASLRVIRPVAVFSTFRMEYSLPHLVLEEIPIPPLRARCQLKDKNHYDAPPDISFLKLKCRSTERQYTLTAYQFTLVTICWDGTKWTTYAFGSNAEEPEESDPDDVNDDEPEEDLIAAHTGHCLDTADPILDPRLYWLINFEKDISKAVDEWEKILLRVEPGFKDYNRSFKLEPGRPMDKIAELMVQAIPCFGELTEWHSTIMRPVERFISPGGDCDYFTDMTDSRAISALEHIEKHLEIFQGQNQSLRSLESRCQQTAKTIEIHTAMETSRRGLESSRLAHDANEMNLNAHKLATHQSRMAFSNNLNAMLMLSTNQYVNAVIVVAACYSMQQPVFGFAGDGKPLTFIVAVILVYLVLRTLNTFTALARRYIRSKHFLALIALGRLERLFDMETDNDLRNDMF